MVDHAFELHAKTTPLSRIILGGQDGLVNVLGVVLGVAIASNETRIILAGGLAATFAESISMAAVVYTSEMAEKDHYQGMFVREKEAIEQNPKKEEGELRALYEKKGFSGKILSDIVVHISANQSLMLATMMREKYGLNPIRTRDVVWDSALVGISAVVGSFVPLVPFFFLPIVPSIVFSLTLSTVALFAVGVYKAVRTVGKPLRSGVEIVVVGMGAAIVGYAIGLLFKSPT